MNRCVIKIFQTIASLIIVFSFADVRAQEFRINKVELTVEGTVLYYDLIDTVKARQYTINLYSSKDSYLSPLQKVKGDVGLEVRPGANKKITWSSKEELGAQFKGNLELEVRGRVYIPFIKFEGFQEEQTIKRGKPKTIIWSGGTRQNILNFSLYKGDGEYVDVIPNVANSGSYDLVIPKSVKPGKGYYFIISDTKNKDQVMRTTNFRVKRKIPLLIQALPLGLAAIAIPFFKGGGSETPEKKPGVEDPTGTPGTPN